MNAPIADVVSLMEQMNDNLDISVDKAPAAFDMIQKGTEGTRATAAGRSIPANAWARRERRKRTPQHARASDR